MGELRESLVVGGEEFELLLGNLHDAVEHGGAELLVLLAELEVDDGVDLAQGLAQEGVKVVFDSVVGAAWERGYRAARREPITAHLLPRWLWSSSMACSSS